MSRIPKPIRIAPAFDDPEFVREMFARHAPYCTNAYYLPIKTGSSGLPWFRGTWAEGGVPLVDGAEKILHNSRTSPSRNSLPITARVWSNSFSCRGSRSMRDASTSCTIGGRRTSLSGFASLTAPLRVSTPWSNSASLTSSMKNGLPSVRSMTRRLSGKRSMPSPSKAVSISSALSLPNGSTRSCV